MKHYETARGQLKLLLAVAGQYKLLAGLSIPPVREGDFRWNFQGFNPERPKSCLSWEVI